MPQFLEHITRSWRGLPLTSVGKMQALIGAATTDTGLTVTCKINPYPYETDANVSEEEMAGLSMTREKCISYLNCTSAPRPASQVKSA